MLASAAIEALKIFGSLQRNNRCTYLCRAHEVEITTLSRAYTTPDKDIVFPLYKSGRYGLPKIVLIIFYGLIQRSPCSCCYCTRRHQLDTVRNCVKNNNGLCQNGNGVCERGAWICLGRLWWSSEYHRREKKHTSLLHAVGWEVTSSNVCGSCTLSQQSSSPKKQ